MSPDEVDEFLAALFTETLHDFKCSPSVKRFEKQFLEACQTYEVARGYSEHLVRSETERLIRISKTVVKLPKRYAKSPLSSSAKIYREKIEKQYNGLTKIVNKLSIFTIRNLSHRYRGPGFKDRIEVNTETLLPQAQQAWGPFSVLPMFQVKYVQLLMSLAHAGMSYATVAPDGDQPRRFKRGRQRPKSKPSRTPLLIDLYAPDATAHPRKRSAEREFETLLAVAWLELTGNAPRQDSRYLAFLQVVFEQVGSLNVDVLALVNEARRQVDKYNVKYAAAEQRARALVQMMPPVEGLLSAADGVAVDGVTSRLHVKSEDPDSARRGLGGSREIIAREADVRALTQEIVSDEMKREAALRTARRQAIRALRKQTKSGKS